jgi:hypothetical protein
MLLDILFHFRYWGRIEGSEFPDLIHMLKCIIIIVVHIAKTRPILREVLQRIRRDLRRKGDSVQNMTYNFYKLQSFFNKCLSKVHFLMGHIYVLEKTVNSFRYLITSFTTIWQSLLRYWPYQIGLRPCRDR